MTKPRPPLPMPEVLYDATRTADVVRVPPRHVLAIDGRGAPDGDAFQRRLGALYGVAYTLKFARKKRGRGEFRIGPLEGRWWADASAPYPDAPRERWRWQLRIAVPDDVDADELRQTIAAAVGKKGGKLEGSAEARQVHLEKLPATTAGRVLHVGPYADEPRSFAAIATALERAGRHRDRPHVEVYLSDPRRTPAARLRTVLLVEATA